MKKCEYYLGLAVQPRLESCYPLDWRGQFQCSAPLAVEIGFGNGAYLVQWAQVQPEWNFVGIDLSGECMERLQKRIVAAGVENICPVRENARFALQEFFADGSIRQVTMNYPDPWPKERHRHRRLLDERFVKILAAVLEDDGMYELVTDQEWYAEHTLELFRQAPWFRVGEIELNPIRPVITKYEQKWKEMGRQSYRVSAFKKKPARLERLLEDEEMPHAFVDRNFNEDSLEALEGKQFVDGDNRGVIKGGFRKLGESRYMLHVITRDIDFQQSFYVAIEQKKSGNWLVKLDSVQPPYRTPAVKMAIRQIATWLSDNENG